jgi:hypothetical protein
VAALCKELLAVLVLTTERQVSRVIGAVFLKIVGIIPCGSVLARHNKGGHERNGGKGKRNDGKDANHCKRESGDVVRRESWSERVENELDIEG